MEKNNFNNITMSQILIFTTTAKFENFSAAANYLNVTQPMVSRCIAQLEKEIGFSLFNRKNQRVSLTSGGRALAASWTTLVESLENSIQSAEEISHQLKESFTISDDRETDKKAYLYPILNRFAEQHPKVMINIEQTDAAWTIDNLYTGNVDIAFLMLHETDALDPDILDWKIVYEIPWCAFVPKNCQLYERESIKVSDLDGEPVVTLSTSASRGYSASLMKIFDKNHISPDIVSRVSNNASLSFAIHQGTGIVLANELMAIPKNSDVKLFRLDGTSDGLCLVWRKSSVNPTIKDFIETAVSFFQS